MRTTIRTAVIGRASLHLIEKQEDGEAAPRYILECVVLHADGTLGPRVVYGEQGFSSAEEAFTFGQEWCQTIGRSQT